MTFKQLAILFLGITSAVGDELAAIADLDTFRYHHQQSRSDKKIKRPKKGGLVEKLDLAMRIGNPNEEKNFEILKPSLTC